MRYAVRVYGHVVVQGVIEVDAENEDDAVDQAERASPRSVDWLTHITWRDVPDSLVMGPKFDDSYGDGDIEEVD